MLGLEFLLVIASGPLRQDGALTPGVLANTGYGVMLGPGCGSVGDP